jgi:hypothetical protein
MTPKTRPTTFAAVPATSVRSSLTCCSFAPGYSR